MTGRRGRPIFIAVLTIAATTAAGWWALPILGAVWGFLDRGPRTTAVVALGGAAGWALILARYALRTSLFPYSATLGRIMHLPGWALLAATVLYAAGLAGFAAAVGGTLRSIGRIDERTRGRPSR